jgi:ABC-type uncharacterized transport system fused permease/ATPase subunit
LVENKFTFLKFGKTYFLTKNPSTFMQISEDSKKIPNVTYTIFLGLINHTLSWTNYTDQLINRLSTVCHAVKQIKPYMSQTMLVTI